jgi:hypothetical protein
LLDVDDILCLLGIIWILDNLRTPSDLERMFLTHPLTVTEQIPQVGRGKAHVALLDPNLVIDPFGDFFDFIIDFLEGAGIGALAIGFEELDVAFVKRCDFLVCVWVFVIGKLLFVLFPAYSQRSSYLRGEEFGPRERGGRLSLGGIVSWNLSREMMVLRATPQIVGRRGRWRSPMKVDVVERQMSMRRRVTRNQPPQITLIQCRKSPQAIRH